MAVDCCTDWQMIQRVTRVRSCTSQSWTRRAPYVVAVVEEHWYRWRAVIAYDRYVAGVAAFVHAVAVEAAVEVVVMVVLAAAAAVDVGHPHHRRTHWNSYPTAAYPYLTLCSVYSRRPRSVD